MRRILAVFLMVAGSPALAMSVSDDELMTAAVGLARQYDTNYAARDAKAMADLYATDGVLISPSGVIVRGRAALEQYYVKRFAAGAHDHHLAVADVHVQGDGGYAISSFSVTSPDGKGDMQEVHGTLVSIYRHDPDGWHLRLVEPSIPEH